MSPAGLESHSQAHSRVETECLHVPFPELCAVTNYPFSFPVTHEPTVQVTLIHSLLPKSNDFFSPSSIRTHMSDRIQGSHSI